MSYDQKFHQMRFDSIQALRGLAALLVVAEHIRFLNFGAFGVDIFFCISGFMIMFTTYQSTEHFLLKRILRIVPFYYLMTVGTFLILLVMPGLFEQTTANPLYLLKSLLFIPFDIGEGVIQPLLRIGWTINCEMFFYLLFGAAMRISHKYRSLLCSLFLGILVLCGQILPFRAAPFIFYSDPLMLEFIMGMLCYEAARIIYRACARFSFVPKPDISRTTGIKPVPEAAGISASHKATDGTPVAKAKSKMRFPNPKIGTGAVIIALCCLTAAIALLLYLILTKHTINILGARRLLYWGLPAMVIVLAFFTAGLLLKTPSWAVRLGDISFSIYLIHYYPVLLIDRKLCDFSALTPRSAAGAAISFLLVTALAWAAWYVIENKFTGWLRGRLLN